MAAQAVGQVFHTRHGDRLMHHHHPQLRGIGSFQQSGHTIHLRCRDLAMLVPPWPRGVDAHHHQLGRAVHGLEIRAERADVAAIGAAKAFPQVEQWNVVVARHGQQRRCKAVRKSACRPELRRPCALRDVARQDEQVGLLLAGQRGQRFHHRRLLGAEVRVRDLHQEAHTAALSVRGRVPLPTPARGGISRYSGRPSTRKSSGARIDITSPSKATFRP